MGLESSVIGLRILFIVLIVGWILFRMMKRKRKKRSLKQQRQLWREGFRERRETRLRTAKTWTDRKAISGNEFPPGTVGAKPDQSPVDNDQK